VFAGANRIVRPMIADRPHMRGAPPSGRTSALVWVISAMTAGFVMQQLARTAWFGRGLHLEELLGMTVEGLGSAEVWRLVSHPLVHSEVNLLHIAGTLAGFFFIGRELHAMIGARRLFGLCGAATLLAAAAWTAVHWGREGHLIGATASVCAMAVVFACLFPDQEMNVLVMFFFPVTLKPKHLVISLFVLEVLGLFFFEIPDYALPGGARIAFSAHLAGMVAGWLYYRFVHDSAWRLDSVPAEPALPSWLRRERPEPAVVASSAPTAAAGAKPAPALDLRQEVDRILDKISSQGIGSLSEAERRVLDTARKNLGRR
jgi:membrane associated rhomboid family serine protease